MKVEDALEVTKAMQVATISQEDKHKMAPFYTQTAVAHSCSYSWINIRPVGILQSSNFVFVERIHLSFIQARRG